VHLDPYVGCACCQVVISCLVARVPYNALLWDHTFCQVYYTVCSFSRLPGYGVDCRWGFKAALLRVLCGFGDLFVNKWILLTINRSP